MAIAGGEGQWDERGAITKSSKLVFQRPLGESGLAPPLENALPEEWVTW